MKHPHISFNLNPVKSFNSCKHKETQEKSNLPPEPPCNVINLSTYKLPRKAYSLLSEGMLFIIHFMSCTCKITPDLNRDLETLREKYIDMYTHNKSVRASMLLKCCLRAIKYDFKISLVHLECDLPRNESIALKHLIRNKNLVISKTNKGDTSVIMPTMQYLNLV